MSLDSWPYVSPGRVPCPVSRSVDVFQSNQVISMSLFYDFLFKESHLYVLHSPIANVTGEPRIWQFSGIHLNSRSCDKYKGLFAIFIRIQINTYEGFWSTKKLPPFYLAYIEKYWMHQDKNWGGGILCSYVPKIVRIRCVVRLLRRNKSRVQRTGFKNRIFQWNIFLWSQTGGWGITLC